MSTPTLVSDGDSQRMVHHGQSLTNQLESMSPALPLADSPLGETIATTPTDVWNDSCALDDLEYALSFGAVGATANPTIVTAVWRSDPTRWRARVGELVADNPESTEVELAWAIVEEMSLAGASLLIPAFERSAGRQGRMSIQTDPSLFAAAGLMVEQGRHFDGLARNVMVKFPVTTAGIEAIESATYLGVSVNATVCFTVSQAVAAAEAVEKGLKRREAEGLGTENISCVVTIMMGRLEDWLRVQVDRDGIVCDPTVLPWSGVAVFKRAYGEFRARGFRARLLGAAIRHRLHWLELIGGDVAITMPASWQRRFNASGLEAFPRMDVPVDAHVIDALRYEFPDFTRAFEPDGLAVDDFDSFGPTMRTLRAFNNSYHDLLHEVADARTPNPDHK
jgi:transaldolase